jgi:glycosyltransferase involved in cell wall biosynthesis
VITVPACNESKTLQKCVESILKQAKELDEDFRIIISEDGSTDGTDKIARELDKNYEHVIHLHSDFRLGKGMALKKAFKTVEGDIYAFVDSDLATSMKFFPKLINLIRQGNDLAFGSRYINGAEIQRDGLRDVSSRLYNLIIRVMFRDHVLDHQIGFKAFSKRLIKDVLDECDSTGWFWDTEIIVRSVNRNYKFVEFPVDWEEKKNGTGSLRMVTEVGLQNVVGIAKLARLRSNSNKS